MTIYEISFKLQHDCPYNDLSREFPELVVSHWCNNERDVLEISCDDMSTFQSLQKELHYIEQKLGVKILRKTFTSNNIQLVLQTCRCDKIKYKVSTVIERYNCLEMEPTIYRDGWEWYRVIAFSQKDIKKLFVSLEQFATVSILSRRMMDDNSVRDTFVISTSSILGGLTTKQTQALLAALDHGYYRIPKKVTTDEIAHRLGLPRTTYEEHLRKAESKVLRAFTPYIQLGNHPGTAQTEAVPNPALEEE